MTRKAIHRREDLLALIRAHRPIDTVDADPPPGTETSIVAALRSRLLAKDTQIAELKATIRDRDRTIAVLHGELEKRIATAGGYEQQLGSHATHTPTTHQVAPGETRSFHDDPTL